MAIFRECSKRCKHQETCLLAQLLNTFGLWNWKFSSYVRHVNSSDLPPFVTAVLSINSSVTFPRHGRITSNRHPHNDDDEYILESLAQVDEARGLVADIMTRIKTRAAPRNRTKFGGITPLGVMTKTFSNLHDLAEYGIHGQTRWSHYNSIRFDCIH